MMFLLDELDKILERIATGGKKRDIGKIRISLPDVKGVNIERMQLGTKVDFPLEPLSHIKNNHGYRSVEDLKFDTSILAQQSPSLNSLFVTLMNTVALTEIKNSLDRQYPSAKLVVCDRSSYNLMIKLRRILTLVKSQNSKSFKNFIYKPPFNVTAIFLLSDLIDLFDRLREPIVIIRQDKSVGKIANYNYSLIRQTFPFIKMTDLIFLIQNKENLKIGNFDPNGSREEQITQFLAHFARTTRLIELAPVYKMLGDLHLFYDNVSISPSNAFDADQSDTNQLYTKLSLKQLSYLSQHLVHLTKKLRLHLQSISVRNGDPYEQNKVFSQLLIASLPKQEEYSEDDSLARVIILDRYYDLQETLMHADRYGAFLEQERHDSVLGDQMIKLRMDTVDELDEQLQLNQLTDVLGSILKYSISLKPKKVSNLKRNKLKDTHLSSALTTTQSIRRHLDIVRQIYKYLNEGYLIILKLEANLGSVSKSLRTLKEPLSAAEQDQLAHRLQRVFSALKQLIKISGKSIRVVEIVRVSCILVDVINMFMLIHNKRGLYEGSSRVINDIRLSLLDTRNMKKLLKDKIDSEVGLVEKVRDFDKTSREMCSYKSTLTLEEIIQKFYSQQLDNDAYSTTILSNKPMIGRTSIILVFLGALTHNELSKIKVLETSLKSNKKSSDIFVLTSGLSSPKNFIHSL